MPGTLINNFDRIPTIMSDSCSQEAGHHHMFISILIKNKKDPIYAFCYLEISSELREASEI